MRLHPHHLRQTIAAARGGPLLQKHGIFARMHTARRTLAHHRRGILIPPKPTKGCSFYNLRSLAHQQSQKKKNRHHQHLRHGRLACRPCRETTPRGLEFDREGDAQGEERTLFRVRAFSLGTLTKERTFSGVGAGHQLNQMLRSS